MKLKNKLLLDVVMLILLLFLMAYPVTNPLIHEILGIVTLICFVIHHLLNRKWYQTLMKGKLSLIKKVYIFINFILLIDILVIFLSGLTMSKLLPFLNFMSIGMARKAHMMATYWGFILMAIHLGLHLQIMLVKIKKYISKQSRVVASIISFIPVLLVIYGIIMFIKNQWITYLFLLREFIFVDPSIGLMQMLIETLAVFILFATLSYLVIKTFIKK